MRLLETASEHKALLPKNGHELFLVLFFRSSEGSLESITACSTFEPIPSFELVAVDLNHAPLLAERFALPKTPVLAAVYDGSILCLDDVLTESTCHELAELALRQKSALLEAAS